ncbi:hypothetical protein [Riemerella anatipestifer]|uniref:hypothetical protein n=1 Tax=Riemerella anatipestifer TaxID=34085 RepID=UPI0021AA2118|nr:hypothetical protein [Riemerella anatipestifer]
MKKTLFCAMFLPLALQAQVGINTNDPKATLEVKKIPISLTPSRKGAIPSIYLGGAFEIFGDCRSRHDDLQYR